ncbi:hypothetical protein JYU34_021899 [Plutella xylostella]|uniref:Major facilitator superfamily (MFS) profile domain-containing protein n=1 Tax=Plutella xylostella TaxID=51655 RepID=A0ABQ7PS56_PLUXY|nr:hypothetical protein JYU34_021899 [Plutella xylostella]
MTVSKTTKEVDEKDIDFDDLLPYAGEFGPYQVFLFMSTLPFYFYFAFVSYGQIFLTEAPQEHWCWIPELENLTALERRSLAIPQDGSSIYGYSRCYSYDVNFTSLLSNFTPPHPSTPTVKCQNGWEFDFKDIPYRTTAVDMAWVCDHNDSQATAQSVFFVGSVVGSLILGWISDRFGRIPVTVCSNILGCVGGIASSFTNTFWTFTATRFIVGMAYDNCVMMIYLLVLEYTAPRYRTAVANTSFALFYSLASCALPWLALLANNWRIGALVFSVPLGFAILTPFIIPESPRWLLSKGRVEEAIQKLNRIAHMNGKVVPEKLLNDFRASRAKPANAVEQLSLLDVFRRPVLRKQFILVCVEYMIVSLVFDSLVRIVGTLGADFFISFTIASLTELPSILLLVVVMDWLGRRWMTATCCLIACIFGILSAYVPKGTASLACAVVARFVTNMSTTGVIQWAPEILPNQVRGAGAAFVHMCGFLATIVSPYVIYLETINPYLPQLIIGAISALGVVIALFIAETSGRTMPQTFNDAETMINDQSFWESPCNRNPNTKAEKNII